MHGQRVYPTSTEKGILGTTPGDYFKDNEGYWRGQTPNGIYVYLRNHHVEEHEDGTISVVSGPWGSNSILAGARGKQWHGYIEKGFWKEC